MDVTPQMHSDSFENYYICEELLEPARSINFIVYIKLNAIGTF